jgi:hypothetical protein
MQRAEYTNEMLDAEFTTGQIDVLDGGEIAGGC